MLDGRTYERSADKARPDFSVCFYPWAFRKPCVVLTHGSRHTDVGPWCCQFTRRP